MKEGAFFSPAPDGQEQKGHTGNDQTARSGGRLPGLRTLRDGQDLALHLPRRGHRRHCSRPSPRPQRAGGRPGLRENARDRPSGAGGRSGLPDPPVPSHLDDHHPARHPDLLHGDQGGTARRFDRADLPTGRSLPGDLLPVRCCVLRPDRLYRNEHRRAGQRPNCRGCVPWRRNGRCPAGCVPHRCRDRHALRRPRPCRSDRHRVDLPELGHRRADRLCFRCFPSRPLYASGRRHLHQGGRCRCGPGGKGRSGNTRRRPPQCSDDRRQRGRQRRRLRRHGRRPLRVLRDHHHRRLDPGVLGLPLPSHDGSPSSTR